MEIAVVALDNHTTRINGALWPAKNPPLDGVAVVDVSQYPPKLVATVEAPTSVVGPPTSIWVAPDESWVLVTAATKINPQNPDKFLDDDRVSVIDLNASPPKVVQQVAAGAGASEVSVSRDGTLALVANRGEGTVSIFTLEDKRLAPADKLDLASPKGLPSSVKFLPDGKTALLTCTGDNQIAVLDIDGLHVTLNHRKIVTGIHPYTLDISRDGTLAVVGNMGCGSNGGIDTVSLIDLTRRPFRAVDTVAVGPSPEGIKFSPDGKIVAAACIHGSTRPARSPFYHDHGVLMMLAVEDQHLRPVVQAPLSRWSQGVAFSKDGKTILVGSMIGRGLDVFRWDDGKLTAGETLDLKGGAAAIRTSWP
jgi:DNA-binding beta-propeller fold protein YncE